MTTKPSTFDCVEMKRQAQHKLRSEYESRKRDFPSYFAFLEAKTAESGWQREFWTKIRKAHGGEE